MEDFRAFFYSECGIFVECGGAIERLEETTAEVSCLLGA